MKTWQEQIPCCFAGMTAPFAMHPNDEKRALAMMETMQEQGGFCLHYAWRRVHRLLSTVLLDWQVLRPILLKILRKTTSLHGKIADAFRSFCAGKSIRLEARNIEDLFITFCKKQTRI